MAVYAGSSKRKRTTWVVAVVAVVAGLVVGMAIGRATAETIVDSSSATLQTVFGLPQTARG